MTNSTPEEQDNDCNVHENPICECGSLMYWLSPRKGQPQLWGCSNCQRQITRGISVGRASN